jgi:hypothetical protein
MELASVKIDQGKPSPDIGEQAAREAVVFWVEADPERYLAEHQARFGDVLNADDAATLFPEYNDDPATYRVVVHPAARWIKGGALPAGAGHILSGKRPRRIHSGRQCGGEKHRDFVQRGLDGEYRAGRIPEGVYGRVKGAEPQAGEDRGDPNRGRNESPAGAEEG